MIVCDWNLWLCVSALLIPNLTVVMCACAPFFAQTWKTLFVRHLETEKGRLYKIPACWSNGTVGKATIVVVTMKRLSSMALREKCTQFDFCPSCFLTLAVTFPCPCPYILPLWPPQCLNLGPPLLCFLLTKPQFKLSSFYVSFSLSCALFIYRAARSVLYC